MGDWLAYLKMKLAIVSSLLLISAYYGYQVWKLGLFHQNIVWYPMMANFFFTLAGWVACTCCTQTTVEIFAKAKEVLPIPEMDKKPQTVLMDKIERLASSIDSMRSKNVKNQ